MCLALYIAAENDLPLFASAPSQKPVTTSAVRSRRPDRFHTELLREEQQIVRSHFSVPTVLFAGSYEGCSCGFNYGRGDDPEYDDDEEQLLAARESVAELVRYVRENSVKELYACCFDDEALPRESERWVAVDDLSSPTFQFIKRQLLRIVAPPNLSLHRSR